ncbi:VWA domain-containing protein [Parerythrobacter aestuarii]|uniref:VWA domain-containing protein n=1 Tax=Parerythrobacter aestuarii TaxID=3020909 RepID=UPI0024DE6F2E|nr:VWA domain-containing protein [Parerythrobacter aestuarii]
MAEAGFLSRILRDTKANMMAIGAAAIIPLVGVVGGGVDASRMYLAQSRLQQACDSATLAARKELSGGAIVDGTIPSDLEATADNFFETNFTPGMYGTTGVNYDLTAGTGTALNGSATASVPTTLMRVFNMPQIDIAVTCSADLSLPNIDVVLVLDNSGSMRNTRIAALKTAVLSFYDEMMAAAPDGARIRIGLVPYANTVNVGSLVMAENADWITDSHTYQSREATFEEVAREVETTDLLPRGIPNLGSTNSAHYHWNANWSAGHREDCMDYEGGVYTVGDEIWYISNVEWDRSYWGNDWPMADKAACRADIRKVSTTETETVFDEYVYKPIVYDTSLFKLGSSVSAAVGTEGALVSATWEGCIEEAKTVATTDYSSIPSGAYDMDIDLIPDATDSDTQWAPLWPEIVFDRRVPENVYTTYTYTSDYEYDCPVTSYKLQEWPLSGTARNSAFEAAVNSMVASGYTMHDIGMIWAGRLISPDGIFAADNATAPNGDAISRHVIFMTDGYMEPGPNSYHAYGDYDVEGRVAGFASDGSWSTSQIGVHHSNRLALICNAIKNKNVTIWSVAFELPHTDYTRDCATGGSTRAFTADDDDELIAAFKEIAASIAELRLVS